MFRVQSIEDNFVGGDSILRTKQSGQTREEREPFGFEIMCPDRCVASIFNSVKSASKSLG